MDQKPTIEDLRNALSGTSPEKKDESVKTDKEITDESAPLKEELERVKSKKSPAQKAQESLYFNAQKAIELGVDITKDENLKKILGIPGTSNGEVKEDIISDDDKPLTKKDLEQYLQKVSIQKTADQMADEISNEYERELVKYHLQNTIKSTGDAQEDLQMAKTLANSARNRKLSELADLKPETRSYSTASGVSAPVKLPEPELTAEENIFLATGKITKEEILLARKGIRPKTY